MKLHPESVELSAGSLSRLELLAELRVRLNGPLAARNREALHRTGITEGERLPRILERQPGYQLWSSTMRASQDLMWHYAGTAVDADLDRLRARLAATRPLAHGTLHENRAIPIPAYLRAADTHRMPGSFFADAGSDDLRAGAMYDIGGAFYQLGIGNRSGRMLNDSRGRTVVSHLRQYYPGLQPARILDLGCGVGHNTVPLAQAYPEARVTAIDVGAPMLRYAHLRAEGLGVPIDFVRDDAEATGFPAGAFDLVVSQILLHETSPQALRRILAESVRLLREGGVVVHLEVPNRFEHLDPVHRAMSLWEQCYNAESNLEDVATADFEGLLRARGCMAVRAGYQPIPPPGRGDPSELLPTPVAGTPCWYVVSGCEADGAVTAGATNE